MESASAKEKKNSRERRRGRERWPCASPDSFLKVIGALGRALRCLGQPVFLLRILAMKFISGNFVKTLAKRHRRWVTLKAQKQPRAVRMKSLGTFWSAIILSIYPRMITSYADRAKMTGKDIASMKCYEFSSTGSLFYSDWRFRQRLAITGRSANSILSLGIG